MKGGRKTGWSKEGRGAPSHAGSGSEDETQRVECWITNKDESYLLDFLTGGVSCKEGVADLLPVDVTEVLEADLRLLELEAAFGVDGSSAAPPPPPPPRE